jgi:integrase
MKRPEPWYWEARKAWYVQLGKKQRKLGTDTKPRRDKAGRPIPPEEVMRSFHLLMAMQVGAEEAPRGDATVAEVCDLFLTVKSRLKPNTYRVYRFFLEKLALATRGRRLDTLQPADVVTVAEGVETWGEATRHDFWAHVAALCRWAREAGHAAYNPLAGHENPFVEGVRQRALTDEEYAKLIGVATDLEFRQIMGFMRGTGCRPGEARRVEARHLHPEKPLIIFGSGEHKTGRKTRKPRLLYMPADVETMVRSLAVRHPTGPLFRNSRNGRGWSRDAIPKRFRVYRRQLGLGEDVVPYLIRHGTLTRLLDNGTSLQHAVAIAGHSGPGTILRTYYHAEHDDLIRAVDEAHQIRK